MFFSEKEVEKDASASQQNDDDYVIANQSVVEEEETMLEMAISMAPFVRCLLYITNDVLLLEAVTFGLNAS